MKVYNVSKELNKVLTEKEYQELLERESKEYGRSVNELMESDTDYKLMEVDLNEGDKITVLDLDNYLAEVTEDDTVLNNSVDDILESKSISYSLTDSWALNVEFNVVEIDEDNKFDSTIEITNIELI